MVDSLRLIVYTFGNMPKRTWQPKKTKRQRKHGFMSRMETNDGQKVLKRRRAHGRAKLTI